MQFKFAQVFHDCILDELESVLGEKGAKNFLFHVESDRYIEDPQKLHQDLYTMFENGAVLLERIIIEELFRRLNLPYREEGDFRFETYASQARKLFVERQETALNE
jgi:hypothetical protein